MSITKSTIGDDFIRTYNIRAKKPKSGYTAAVGDLTVPDFTLADGVDRGASNENPTGIVISINSSNGTLSIAELTGGVTIVLEYTSTAPTLGQKIECNGDRGTVLPSRDRVRVDDTNGVGAVIAVGVVLDPSVSLAPSTCCVRFP